MIGLIMDILCTNYYISCTFFVEIWIYGKIRLYSTEKGSLWDETKKRSSRKKESRH